jgi:RsiW-degrading membrane proteinase PrsW (M82 family)
VAVFAVAFLPVLAFLGLLLVFDSFKLVPANMLVRALAAGAVAALLSTPLHSVFVLFFHLSEASVVRDVAPISEEVLKALFFLYALRRRFVGFLVDAAIIGFAIGTGFAVVENIQYLETLSDRRLWLWVVRGFGTATLHALTTAIVAIAAKSLTDRFPERGLIVILPGLVAAIALHSAFNHALVSPVLSAAILVLLLPLVVLLVFSRSEKMTREWVGDGLDLDIELLALVRSSEFGSTRFGKYLGELRTRFPGPVVADMFCLLQLDLELAIRAKGLLMAREAGLEVPPDDTLRDRLAERDYLEHAIGQTGLLALRPLQVTSDRDHWHQYLLKSVKT